MKKFLAITLAALLAFSVTGCGNAAGKEEETTVQEETAANEDVNADAEAAVAQEIPEQPKDYGTAKLGEYKGLKVDVASMELSPEAIQDEIDLALEQNPDTKDVTDRAAKIGDTCNIDYEGKKDGIAFDGGTAQGYDLTLGSNTFIAGFEDGVVGMKLGETKDINLSFPDDYWNEELAGAPVVFTVKLNKITEKTPAKLTDEWVKKYSMGNLSTVAEFKAQVEEDLKRVKETEVTQNAQMDLLAQIENTSEFKQNQQAVDYEYALMYQNYVDYANMVGVDIETYVGMNGMELPDFEAGLRIYADEIVKQRIMVDTIAEKEGLKITDEEREAVAQSYGLTVDEAIEAYGQETLDLNAKAKKVFDFLYENADKTFE